VSQLVEDMLRDLTIDDIHPVGPARFGCSTELGGSQ
jgi:hypothetical protein